MATGSRGRAFPSRLAQVLRRPIRRTLGLMAELCMDNPDILAARYERRAESCQRRLGDCSYSLEQNACQLRQAFSRPVLPQKGYLVNRAKTKRSRKPTPTMVAITRPSRRGMGVRSGPELS